MRKELNIIGRAQIYLEKQPTDAAHGAEHHRCVVKNCLAIIKVEHLQVNQINVVIAAWWHDVETQQGKTNLLEREMKASGFDDNTISTVSDIVKSHTFGEEQKTVEAKILFDADKLEYFNPKRMYKAIEDVQRGILPVESLRKHYEAWRQRYQEVLNSFNFKFSEEIAHRTLPATQIAIEKIGAFLVASKH